MTIEDLQELGAVILDRLCDRQHTLVITLFGFLTVRVRARLSALSGDNLNDLWVEVIERYITCDLDCITKEKDKIWLHMDGLTDKFDHLSEKFVLLDDNLRTNYQNDINSDIQEQTDCPHCGVQIQERVCLPDRLSLVDDDEEVDIEKA